MKRNRKKSETYRFNGYPHLNAGSIHSVGIAELETGAKEFERKLADPADPDDKKWVKGWLDRYRAELEKKQRGLALKGSSRLKEHRRRQRRRAPLPLQTSPSTRHDQVLHT